MSIRVARNSLLLLAILLAIGNCSSTDATPTQDPEYLAYLDELNPEMELYSSARTEFIKAQFRLIYYVKDFGEYPLITNPVWDDFEGTGCWTSAIVGRFSGLI